MISRRPKSVLAEKAAASASEAAGIYSVSHRTVSEVPEGTRTVFLRNCRIPESFTLPDSVTRVTLAACGLKEVPAALLALPRMQTVHLPKNSIRALPSTLPSCWKHIMDVSLDYNNLEDVTPLATLPHLRRLSVCHNNLSMLPSDLPRSLVELRLDGNKLTAVPETLAKLPLLRIATVDDNDIADLTPLADGADTAKIMLSAQRNRRPLPADTRKFVVLSERDARASVKEVLRRRAFVASTKLDW